MLQNCKIDINYKDIKTKQIIVKIALVIMIMLTKTSAEQLTLIDLLEINKIEYIIMPDTNETTYITRTGKITTATGQSISGQSTAGIIHNNITEINTTITDQTIYILEPLPEPRDIIIDTNKREMKITEIEEILKDTTIYKRNENKLILKRKWKLRNLITYEEKTGTYEELLRKSIEEINKKETNKKELKLYYSLIPTPELLKLCILTQTECYQINEDTLLIENNKEDLKTYITETRPKIQIQAYILFLSKTAKDQINLELSLKSSRITTPDITQKGIQLNTTTIGTQIEAQIQALIEKNKANIIASPSLILDDRQTANIRQGYEIPVITPATQTSPATVTYRNAYLSLSVQPVLLPNNQIRLVISLTKDSPDFSLKISENIPIQTNAIQTTITVEQNTPILIGGVEEKINSNRTGFGFLFFNKEKEDTKKELYILLIARTM